MTNQHLIITPCPKPRMTQKDRWKPRRSVTRYWEFKDEVNRLFKDVLPESLHIEFYLPMPKSWSKKKRLELNGQPHRQTPDIDNLVKGFLDALLVDDAHIHTILAKKVWSETGKITIKNLEN